MQETQWRSTLSLGTGQRPFLHRWQRQAGRLLGCALFLVHATASASGVSGIVISVRDGDSVVLRTAEGRRFEVRLNGIDAPEKGRGGQRGQPYAESSRRNLRDLAIGRRAALYGDKTDLYNRRVGMLFVETPAGPVDVGLQQVRKGMAWVYTRYLDELPPGHRRIYLDAERQARAQRLGLWQGRAPEPPWEWRHRQAVMSHTKKPAGF